MDKLSTLTKKQLMKRLKKLLNEPKVKKESKQIAKQNQNINIKIGEIPKKRPYTRREPAIKKPLSNPPENPIIQPMRPITYTPPTIIQNMPSQAPAQQPVKVVTIPTEQRQTEPTQPQAPQQPPAEPLRHNNIDFIPRAEYDEFGRQFVQQIRNQSGEISHLNRMIEELRRQQEANRPRVYPNRGLLQSETYDTAMEESDMTETEAEGQTTDADFTEAVSSTAESEVRFVEDPIHRRRRKKNKIVEPIERPLPPPPMFSPNEETEPPKEPEPVVPETSSQRFKGEPIHKKPTATIDLSIFDQSMDGLSSEAEMKEKSDMRQEGLLQAPHKREVKQTDILKFFPSTAESSSTQKEESQSLAGLTGRQLSMLQKYGADIPKEEFDRMKDPREMEDLYRHVSVRRKKSDSLVDYSDHKPDNILLSSSAQPDRYSVRISETESKYYITPKDSNEPLRRNGKIIFFTTMNNAKNYIESDFSKEAFRFAKFSNRGRKKKAFN